MDRQLLERLIGAGVLVIALVLIVPAVLDGEGEDKRVPGIEPAVPATNDELRRTHTIRLDRSPQSPPVARAVPQPEAATRETADTASSRDPDKPVSTSTSTRAPWMPLVKM